MSVLTRKRRVIGLGNAVYGAVNALSYANVFIGPHLERCQKRIASPTGPRLQEAFDDRRTCLCQVIVHGYLSDSFSYEGNGNSKKHKRHDPFNSSAFATIENIH